VTEASPSATTAPVRAESPDAPDKLMHLGEIAERTGLSHRTLRFYDESGLLTPTARSAGNFRLYSNRDLERLLLIRRMKPLGYTIEQMRRLMVVMGVVEPDPQAASDDELEDIDDFIASARKRRERLQRHLEWADDFIALLEKLSDRPTEGA
jgi:DNA-binding transcriptional MerR regulator